LVRNGLTILCWNIGNPSVQRADRQANWLTKVSPDIIVLTETKASDGCSLLKRHFRSFLGYTVLEPPLTPQEYGVMILSREPIRMTNFQTHVTYLPERVLSVRLSTHGTEIEIIAVYAPARDSSPIKIERKQTFLRNLKAALQGAPVPGRMICGDLNLLEPNHVPRYAFFEDWEYAFYKDLQEFGFADAFRYFHPYAREYSWVGPAGDGYRYDHCFVTHDVLSRLKECYYLHEPRLGKLSDHSPLVVELEFSQN
jgi:exodeoxyribonuclease-3